MDCKECKFNKNCTDELAYPGNCRDFEPIEFEETESDKNTRMYPHPTPGPDVWDWFGACNPERCTEPLYRTFSVGIFQWKPKKRGGFKKGTVIKRFSGSVEHPEKVYKKAHEYCQKLNTERNQS